MSEMLGGRNVVADTRSMRSVVALKGNVCLERVLERLAQAGRDDPSDVRGRRRKSDLTTRKLVGSHGNLVVAVMTTMKRHENDAVLRENALQWKRDTQPLTQFDIASMTPARRRGGLRVSTVRSDTTRAAANPHEFRDMRLPESTKRWRKRPDEQSVGDFTVNAKRLLQ